MSQRQEAQIAQEILTSWKEANSDENPVILLVGGLQGSGKSTLIETLAPEFNLAVISGDEIRYRLREKGVHYDEEEVISIRDQLVKEATSQGLSFAIDSNMTPQRVKHIQSLLTKPQLEKYKIAKILLVAQKEVLIQRIRNRPQVPGKYIGIEEELEPAILRHGKIDESTYDLKVDVSQKSPNEVAILVSLFLERL